MIVGIHFFECQRSLFNRGTNLTDAINEKDRESERCQQRETRKNVHECTLPSREQVQLTVNLFQSRKHSRVRMRTGVDLFGNGPELLFENVDRVRVQELTDQGGGAFFPHDCSAWT